MVGISWYLLHLKYFRGNSRARQRLSDREMAQIDER